MDLFKTLSAFFPHVRLFADRKQSWSSPKPFAHLVFFASKRSDGVKFNFPAKVINAEDPPKGKKVHTWKSMSDWEQLISEAELSQANLILDKENALIKWYKKTARDFKADMRYKVPLRVWNLAQDYLKISKDNPYEDDDDDDDGYDQTGEGGGDPRFKNVPADVLKQLKEMGANLG